MQRTDQMQVCFVRYLRTCTMFFYSMQLRLKDAVTKIQILHICQSLIGILMFSCIHLHMYISKYSLQCHGCCRFGSCERYRGSSVMCNSTLAGKYVFIPSVRGLNQDQIGSKLDSNIISVISGDSQECQDIITMALCNIYFSPCGTEGNQTIPVSLCREECEHVVDSCTPTWNFIQSTLADEPGFPLVDCNNPSTILPPIPSCCSDFGIDTTGQGNTTCKITSVSAVRQSCYT